MESPVTEHASPFRPETAEAALHHGPAHEEALARLDFLVRQRRRVGLLLGASGSGKSSLLARFAAALRRRGRPVAMLGLLGLDVPQFLGGLLAEWGRGPIIDGTPARLWQALADCLREHDYQEQDVAILCDDADRAEPAVLVQLARLAKFEPVSPPRLTLILACQGETVARLGEAILDLVDLRIDLEPWLPADTEEYLRGTLQRGGLDPDLFYPTAVRRLHELSAGSPRRVNRLADLALLAGRDQRLQRIDAEVVESVCRELSLIAWSGSRDSGSG